MNLKINEHTRNFIKRQAKKIASQLNIPHHQALNKAAVNAGFQNWKHFINASKNLPNLSTNPKDLDLSAVLLKTDSSILKRKKVHPHRNLLVAAINTLLQQKRIDLKGSGLLHSDKTNEDCHIIVELFGYTTVISWQEIGWQELRVTVWWKYNHDGHPQANLSGNRRERFRTTSPLAKKHRYKEFVGVVASCWLERETGKYIQGKDSRGIFDVYTRASDKLQLQNLPVQIPSGYEVEGKLHI